MRSIDPFEAHAFGLLFFLPQLAQLSQSVQIGKGQSWAGFSSCFGFRAPHNLIYFHRRIYLGDWKSCLKGALMVKYCDNLSEDEREQTPLEDYEDVVAYDCEGVFYSAKLGSRDAPSR